MGYEDFLIAASNLGFIIYTYLDKLGVGELIYRIISSTYEAVKTNVNLGIALLLVPLAKAYWKDSEELRSSLRGVLDSLTVEDSRWVYKAIRMVSPGGIGRSSIADVSEEPNITLKEAMEIASERDSIAYEYASDYKISFEIVYPCLKTYKREGMSWEDAIVQAYLDLLAEVPDTLIARKYGMEEAIKVSERAKIILSLGGVKTAEGREAIRLFDLELREGKVKRNPGTSADLITSGLMLYLLLEKERI